MECHDAPTVFKSKRSNRETGQTKPRSQTTIGVLTEDHHLFRQIQAALAQDDTTVLRMSMADSATHYTSMAKTDVLLIHLQRSDICSGISCRLVDAAAKARPTIVLCDSPEDARYVTRHATRTIQSLPIQVVRDERFPSVIEAALLRSARLAEDYGVGGRLWVA